MKIGTNSVGNYTPQINKTFISSKLKDAGAKAADSKVNNEDVKITSEEKEFFSKIFPSNNNEINNYHFYEKDGKMSGVKLGSLLDRRG